jgi:uncharacterized protein
MIIADTGFFVALGNQSDRFHTQAVAVLSQFSESLITTYPVISETCYLLARESGIAVECTFLREIATGRITIFQLETSHLNRIADLIERYADLPMDLADASLVVLAEQLGHGRILTVDRRDFSVYRWQNNQAFENLLLL